LGVVKSGVKFGDKFIFLRFYVFVGLAKTIQISDEVWAELTHLKADLKARSLDEVLRRLLEAWKHSKQ